MHKFKCYIQYIDDNHKVSDTVCMLIIVTYLHDLVKIHYE